MKTMMIWCLLLTGYWTVYGDILPAHLAGEVYQSAKHRTFTVKGHHDGKGSSMLTTMQLWLTDHLKFSDTSDIWTGSEILAPRSLKALSTPERPLRPSIYPIRSAPFGI